MAAIVFLLFLVTACSSPRPVTPSEPVPAQLWRQIAPAADHHQHLFSPEAASLINIEPLPPVGLPADIALLLHSREAHWNDAAGLAELFTLDVLVFDQGWTTGRDQAAIHLSTRFSAPFSLVPVAFQADGQSASVAGYITRGEGETLRRISQFYLALVKSPDGRWRISTEASVLPLPAAQGAITADMLIAMLDRAGIRRAAVLSEGFWFDASISGQGDDVYASVRAENDWTAGEAARYPDRLIPFCSFNPLRDYALAELRRCARDLAMRGLKLSFGTSGVDLRDPVHVEQVREVFAEADRLGQAIVVHVRDGGHYGRAEATIFLDRIVTAAPRAPVQIAHLWGGEQYSSEALTVFADAFTQGHPATTNLWFDAAEIAVVGASEDELQHMADAMRQIGLARILYGSDAAFNDRLQPREAWKMFVSSIPLTAEEFRIIAVNEAPYLP